MAPHPNVSPPEDNRALPSEPPVDNLLAASRGRTALFASAITGFAEMLAPQRRIIRNPSYGAAIRPDEQAPTGDVCFTAAEWAMIVTAGVVLGVALTLTLAGS